MTPGLTSMTSVVHHLLALCNNPAGSFIPAPFVGNGVKLSDGACRLGTLISLEQLPTAATISLESCSTIDVDNVSLATCALGTKNDVVKLRSWRPGDSDQARSRLNTAALRLAAK